MIYPIRSIDPTPAEPSSDGARPASTTPGSAASIPARESEHAVPPRQRLDLPGSFDPRVIVGSRPDSPAANVFRVLRHRLALHGNPRVITISSALPKEGRTTCAMNLALAMAEEDARVLVLEADTQNPTLLSLFGARPSSPNGFWTSFVVDPHELSIAAITPTEEPSSLGRERFFDAVAQAKAWYDYVIIDAPSVLECPDAHVCATCSDAVLLAARARRTRKRHVRQAVKQLWPVRVLGTVLLETRTSEL